MHRRGARSLCWVLVVFVGAWWYRCEEKRALKSSGGGLSRVCACSCCNGPTFKVRPPPARIASHRARGLRLTASRVHPPTRTHIMNDTCVPYVCASGWEPRAELSNCEAYTSGMYVQPCILPFGNMPPLFLACFFGCIVGLTALFWSCRQPTKEAAHAADSAPPKVGGTAEDMPHALPDSMSTTRVTEHAQI